MSWNIKELDKSKTEQSITNAGVCGTLGSVKWYKGSSTTVIATAKSITVSASDVMNLAMYTAQLEDQIIEKVVK